jgi:NADPH-dependent 2,4-dienoyl-CoA reductase/sulfur reductase-like enzyme
MINQTKIIVVGGNAAGPAAAAKAKRVNPSADVKMFEAGEFISTGTCEIPYVLSGEIKNYEDIVYFSPESFKEKKGIDVYTKHFVEEINTRDKYVVVRDLIDRITRQFQYDKLILATGSKPGTIESISEGKNVFTLTSIKDLIEINNFIVSSNVKSAVIIGSGYIGLEIMDSLRKLGMDVTLIEREKLPLPNAETEIQHLILELIHQNDIRFFGEVTDFKPVFSDDKVKSLNINGRILEPDLILVSIGFAPNSLLASKAKLAIGKFGGIKVDNKLKTSNPHILAAGDCIEVINAVTNKPSYIPIATLAHEYGHTAGENAAGANVRVQPAVKNIAVKIMSKYFISIGLSSGEAAEYEFNFNSVSKITNNLVPVMPESEKVFGKIIYEKESGRILGASFFGGKEVSGYGDLISVLIRTKQKADVLSTVNYNYTPPLSPFVNLLSLLGRKIK